MEKEGSWKRRVEEEKVEVVEKAETCGEFEEEGGGVLKEEGRRKGEWGRINEGKEDIAGKIAGEKESCIWCEEEKGGRAQAKAKGGIRGKA